MISRARQLALHMHNNKHHMNANLEHFLPLSAGMHRQFSMTIFFIMPYVEFILVMSYTVVHKLFGLTISFVLTYAGMHRKIQYDISSSCHNKLEFGVTQFVKTFSVLALIRPHYTLRGIVLY